MQKRFEILGSVVFSEIRASIVGSNGGGEGAEEERRRWGEDDAKTRGGWRYLEMRGLRSKRNNRFFNVGEAGRAEYF